MSNLKFLKVGDKAPSFEAKDQNGINFSDVKLYAPVVD